ncbi:MAG TPA: hypothetical protein VM487_10100, partial [Phycisphaerae bacterium]|nr:hypothetical protein [Phycisphaerae bacterium]
MMKRLIPFLLTLILAPALASAQRYNARGEQVVDVGDVSAAGTVDDSMFTAGTDEGTNLLCAATADTIDSGDVGVIACNTAREPIVQAKQNGTWDVTNAGTFAVQVDGSFVFADDAPFTLTSSFAAVMGAVRDDALSTLAAVEFDAVVLRVSAEGALWTQDFNSDAVLADTTAILADTTAILADTAAIQTAVEIVDNAVYVDDGEITLATDSGIGIMGVFTGDVVDAGDVAFLAMSSDRRLL